MRNILTKGWVLFMLVIVALGLIGIGYTLWTKQQQIEGVIQLNTLDVAKIKAFTNDDNIVDFASLDVDDVGSCQGQGITSCDPIGPANEPASGDTPRTDKDVATCIAAIDAAATGEKMDFHIFDGYPSYWCTVWFIDHNVGSVPVKLQKVKMSGVAGFPAGAVVCPSDTVDIDADQNGEIDANVHFVYPALGTQLDSSDELRGRVDVHVKQGAPQGLAFSFLIELIWVQWNLYDAADPDNVAAGCGNDVIIDADGIATVGDGLGTCGSPVIAGAQQVAFGDPLTTWPASDPDNHGIDILEGVVDSAWTSTCSGDDIHIEGASTACPTGDRDGFHQDGTGASGPDCVVLDYDGSLAEGDTVDCDLESGFFCTGTLLTDLVFFDTDGDGAWDDGEDIVVDTNGNGVFD